ncbi:MAG: TRAP transporter substrate-binding protein, partial [Sphaerochaetaceae bacterium]|nr:TRAP transporter substrate-binding protein [Sphaerochaetaceae bacterium]
MFFCICCTLAIASGKAEAAPSQEEKLVLRYADNQPADYPTTLAAKRLAELVEQRTNGRIRIEVFCDG